MADKKTYYYLKLKEGFFDSEDMLLLQGMKDGYIYSDILLKLYLMSLRQDGRLMYRGIIPYTPDMVATITHHQVGTVEKAMKVLTSMGFIEIKNDKCPDKCRTFGHQRIEIREQRIKIIKIIKTLAWSLKTPSRTRSSLFLWLQAQEIMM